MNYAKAQRIDPTLSIDSESWGLLCWLGAVSGFAMDVMGACESAVKTAPMAMKEQIRVARGLARAMTGEYPGAIDDFNAYVGWSKINDEYGGFEQEVEGWLHAMEAGKNPFDEATLEALRHE